MVGRRRNEVQKLGARKRQRLTGSSQGRVGAATQEGLVCKAAVQQKPRFPVPVVLRVETEVLEWSVEADARLVTVTFKHVVVVIVTVVVYAQLAVVTFKLVAGAIAMAQQEVL
uniref:Uncharacterized protein n=1 Tax=Phytophthora ramorum TaxID=164328 RepID=H3H525_PHYRM